MKTADKNRVIECGIRNRELWIADWKYDIERIQREIARAENEIAELRKSITQDDNAKGEPK